MSITEAPKLQIIPPKNPARGSVSSVSTDVYEIVRTQRLIAEVAAAPVKVDYFPVAGSVQCDLLVSLPHNCYLDGHITFFDEGKHCAYMGNWHVNEELRGNGIGRRLMESYYQQARSIGVAEIYTSVVSPEGLRGVSSFFGFENLEMIGVNANIYVGMPLQQLLDLMELNPRIGYPFRILISPLPGSIIPRPQKS